MTKTLTRPKAADLEGELATTREKIRILNEQLDATMGFDLSVTTEIQALRDHERRIGDRLAEARQREADLSTERDRRRFLAEYGDLVKAVAVQQDVVERLVDELITAADELRELDRELQSAARRVEKAGGEITTRPPVALWQRHAGEAVPYAERVRKSLVNL